MKTREQIYNGESELLLQVITTYHALPYEQLLKLFPKKSSSFKSFITGLVKQGRIYHDKEKNLLCDCKEASENPDWALISALWIMVDFNNSIVYHTSGTFPVKLHFFTATDYFEIIYIGEGQEALFNHVMEHLPSGNAKRIILLDSAEQAGTLNIDGTIAYCLVSSEGVVSYYTMK